MTRGGPRVEINIARLDQSIWRHCFNLSLFRRRSLRLAEHVVQDPVNLMWMRRSTSARRSIGLVVTDLIDRHRSILHGVHATQQGFGISPQPAVSLLELVSDLDAAPAVHRAA